MANQNVRRPSVTLDKSLYEQNEELQSLMAEINESMKMFERDDIRKVAYFKGVHAVLENIKNQKNDSEGVEEVIQDTIENGGKITCGYYEGYPDENSPHGLYMNDSDSFENIQYAIFSSKSVAKKSLEVINTDEPIIFGVFSRIKREGVEDLLDFFEGFINLLLELNITKTNLELGSLDLSRLGRSYLSFSALFTMFELASDNGIGIRFMNSAEPVALFGICTGAISQTNMRFNQTLKRLKSRYRKSLNPELDIMFKEDQYAKSAVSDLVNNKTAYQPHLSTMEYYKKITEELGTDEWKVFL